MGGDPCGRPRPFPIVALATHAPALRFPGDWASATGGKREPGWPYRRKCRTCSQLHPLALAAVKYTLASTSGRPANARAAPPEIHSLVVLRVKRASHESGMN